MACKWELCMVGNTTDRKKPPRKFWRLVDEEGVMLLGVDHTLVCAEMIASDRDMRRRLDKVLLGVGTFFAVETPPLDLGSEPGAPDGTEAAVCGDTDSAQH